MISTAKLVSLDMKFLWKSPAVYVIMTSHNGISTLILFISIRLPMSKQVDQMGVENRDWTDNARLNQTRVN